MHHKMHSVDNMLVFIVTSLQVSDPCTQKQEICHCSTQTFTVTVKEQINKM